MATSLNNTGHDMKIIVIGASGILGQAVVTHLHALGHDVITASRSSGMEQVDIRDDVEQILPALLHVLDLVDQVRVALLHGRELLERLEAK